MITTYSYRDVLGIEAEAWRAFDCHPVASGKGGRKRDAKRDKVTRTTQRFFDAINGPNPPHTKEEAVEMITPFIGLILSMLFKQLAVMVIEWLWDRTQKQVPS